VGYETRYLKRLGELFNEVEIKGVNGRSWSIEDAFSNILKIIKNLKDSSNKLIFIGNGGSAAIASHQSIDYWKNGNIPAISFNDPSLLTCLSNDYGYEFVFEKPINMFGKKGDVLIAISSSGESENILTAVESAKKEGIIVITLSGFSKSNPLRNYGDLNFFVPSKVYGFVEITHLAICHAILDSHMTTQI